MHHHTRRALPESPGFERPRNERGIGWAVGRKHRCGVMLVGYRVDVAFGPTIKRVRLALAEFGGRSKHGPKAGRRAKQNNRAVLFIKCAHYKQAQWF